MFDAVYVQDGSIFFLKRVVKISLLNIIKKNRLQLLLRSSEVLKNTSLYRSAKLSAFRFNLATVICNNLILPTALADDLK